MRVLIADDHALFRDGLRSLLEARGIEVVAEARNGQEAVELARLHRPERSVISTAPRAINSAVECVLHTDEVAGSNPAAPTESLANRPSRHAQSAPAQVARAGAASARGAIRTRDAQRRHIRIRG